MADENSPPGTSPPAAPPQPATPAAPPPGSTLAEPPAGQEPNWLTQRIQRASAGERESVLKELGVTDVGKAKEAISAANKAAEDAKSAGQKLGETSKTLETEKARADRLEAAVKDHATRQLATLTAEQQAAVRKIAPDADPAAQLQAIDALLPTWATPAVAATTTTTTPGASPAPAAPAAPAATTMPPANAPNGTNTTPPDHKAEYQRLKATNPGAAVAYLHRFENQIYPRA